MMIWIILFISALLIPVMMIGKDEDTMGIVITVLITIQMIGLIGCIFPTESELRRKFARK